MFWIIISVKNVVWNPEKFEHQYPVHFLTSVVGCCYFTLGNPTNSVFSDRQAVGRVSSGVCDCVSVCVFALLKENGLSYQHQTWYANTVHSSRSACTDPEVKRSKITRLCCQRGWVCMSTGLLRMFAIFVTVVLCQEAGIAGVQAKKKTLWAFTLISHSCCTLFHDPLSRPYVCRCVWSVITAHNFTPAKRDESFSAMFTEPYRSSASSLVMK